MIEREYAKALWELALEENKSKLFRDYFAATKACLKNNDFISIMTSPIIDKAEKKKIIKKVLNKFDETFINFLYVLIDHNRFLMLDDIGHQYRKYYRVSKNIIVVDVYSSKELKEKQLKDLKDALEQKYEGKTIEMKFTIVPELIGGVRLVTNGESIDLNVKNSLDRLKEAM